MQTLPELGAAVAAIRKAKGLKQIAIARSAQVTPESLSRFERGRLPEFGARKLLAILEVLGMQMQFVEEGQSGNLDDLRRERGGT